MQAQPRAALPSLKVVDSAPEGWLLAEVQGEHNVVFEPYSEAEVEMAVRDVATMLQPLSA